MKLPMIVFIIGNSIHNACENVVGEKKEED